MTPPSTSTLAGGLIVSCLIPPPPTPQEIGRNSSSCYSALDSGADRTKNAHFQLGAFRSSPTCAPAPARFAFLRVRGTPVCPHSRRNALLLIGAPFVSGFATMAQCGDNDGWLQQFLAFASIDPAQMGGLSPAQITCSMVSSFGGCDQPAVALMCAQSCKYSGACKGDEALAVIFAPDPDAPPDDQTEPLTCASLVLMELFVSAFPTDGSGGQQNGGQQSGGQQSPPPSQADQANDQAGMDLMMSIGKDMCGMRRARKMTAAPQADAPKARKLAAAMLRTIKTTARRLTQAAVSPHPTAAPLPMLRAALPSPFLHPPAYTLQPTPSNSTQHPPIPTCPRLFRTPDCFPTCRSRGCASRRAPTCMIDGGEH